MRILFISSGNKFPEGSIIVRSQIGSLSGMDLEIDHYLIKGKGISGYLRNLSRISKQLREHNYDLVHSHYSYSALITSMALLRNRRPPHIVSLMGSDAYSKGLSRAMIRMLSRRMWNRTIVKSEAMAMELGLPQARVIPNGIDINKITSIENTIKTEEMPDLSGSRLNILFASNPNRPEKNFRLAKEAAEIAQIKLEVVYGVSHSFIIKKILRSGIVLLTSTHEGSPNIIKEAMACNRPIVTTDVGDVRHLFGEVEGHFIASAAASDLAEKLLLAKDFLLRSNETKGRERILRLKLDNISVAKQLKSLYGEFQYPSDGQNN